MGKTWLYEAEQKTLFQSVLNAFEKKVKFNLFLKLNKLFSNVIYKYAWKIQKYEYNSEYNIVSIYSFSVFILIY